MAGSPDLFDTHAHLDEVRFDTDRAEVVSRAAAAGVTRMVAVATTAHSSQTGLRLAAEFAGVYPSVGIHPNYLAALTDGEWSRIEELARQPGVVALGETGLDKHWDDTPWEVQLDYFQRHLRLSQQTGLPVIIHTRDCQVEMLAALRDATLRFGPLRGVMHSFTGDAQMAADCLALGLYISFAGMVTFKKSDDLRAVAATVPTDRILIETDCPYLAPHPLRGQRNEPAHLQHTAACLAGVRGLPLADFAAQTTANALRLFGIPS
ncbi:MAG: TatD family hydrolase [Pirellulales bacterium]